MARASWLGPLRNLSFQLGDHGIRYKAHAHIVSVFLGFEVRLELLALYNR